MFVSCLKLESSSKNPGVKVYFSVGVCFNLKMKHYFSDEIDWIFSPVEKPHNPGKVWLWWEKRRPFYNLFVVVVLLASYGLHIFFYSCSPCMQGVDIVPTLNIMFMGYFGWIIWNLAYTLGPLVDVVNCAFFNESKGPIFMKMGLAFSFIVLSVPALIGFYTFIANCFT